MKNPPARTGAARTAARKALPAPKRPGSKKPALEVYQGTREEWAQMILGNLFLALTEIGIAWNTPTPRELRVALAPLPRTTLGRCHSSKKSVGGNVNMIDLSTDQGDPLELTHTLLHELLHALDDCHSGHRGRWRRWADQIGIERVGHKRGPIAEKLVQDALAAVGTPGNHVQTVPSKRKAESSQIRFACPECSRHVHMPRKLADEGFAVGCVECEAAMQPQEAA